MDLELFRKAQEIQREIDLVDELANDLKASEMSSGLRRSKRILYIPPRVMEAFLEVLREEKFFQECKIKDL